jgi:hypothetical protein
MFYYNKLLKNKIMKSLLFIILTSFSSLSIGVSQNSPIVRKLDEKNGFKDFQIGDSFSKWQPNLAFTNSNGAVNFYIFNGSCCQQLFTTDLERIRLGFKENKLVTIYLETKEVRKLSDEWVSSNYRNLKENFESLFGVNRPDTKSIHNGEIKVSSLWMGEKLFLQLTYEDMGIKLFGNYFDSAGRCTIAIGLNSEIKDGF